ncbi:MAG TPA: hypothetical protein VGL61_05205 [Kofleriaceae bacterium]|jgi:hypothetical protein
MTVDMDALRELVSQAYVKSVFDAYGDRGTRALRPLLQGVKNIYTVVEPRGFSGRFVVFTSLDPTADIYGRATAVECLDVSAVAREATAPGVVEVAWNGRYYVWKADCDPQLLIGEAIVYAYANNVEVIYARDAMVTIPPVLGAMTSAFAVPAFADLESALEHYRTKLARECTCRILHESWRDDRRLMFVAGPEVVMRRSLYQFLNSVIRGAEVRPEQIVDETHPVDLKVTWDMARRVALIEIKWLGDSYNDGNDPVAHRDARANSGAKQLADYLNANQNMVPDHVSRGYLVIIDGRRRGLGPDGELKANGNAAHFRDVEIVFAPKYHEQRTDFATPIRMFVEAKVA